MPIVEDLKEYAERATGLRRPGKRRASELPRPRKPHVVRFRDDGLVPNHPRWPLMLYRSAVSLDEQQHDPAAVLEDLFESNGWGDSWRNGIYDYVHYHSRTHEVPWIARGKGRVRFGGNKGRIFTLSRSRRFLRSMITTRLSSCTTAASFRGLVRDALHAGREAVAS